MTVFNILTILKVTEPLQFFPLIIRTPLQDFSLPSHFYSPALLCKGRSAYIENPPDVVLMARAFTANISNFNLLAGKSIFQGNLLYFINILELSSI